MSLADRLGWAALIVALLGIATIYLWPTQKWIGYVALAAAVVLGCVWGVLEIKERRGSTAIPEARRPENHPEPEPQPPPKTKAKSKPIASAESFVYVVPGVWSPAPQPAWLMMVKHFGPDPVFNIEILFVDKDRQAALSKKLSATIDDIQSMDRTLNFPEIDPIVGVWAKQFLWPVLNADDSHYEASIASRNGAFFETFEVKKDAEGKWVDRITVVSRQTNKALIDCRDPNFVETGNTAPLPRCFPEYVVGRK